MTRRTSRRRPAGPIVAPIERRPRGSTCQTITCRASWPSSVTPAQPSGRTFSGHSPASVWPTAAVVQLPHVQLASLGPGRDRPTAGPAAPPERHELVARRLGPCGAARPSGCPRSPWTRCGECCRRSGRSGLSATGSCWCPTRWVSAAVRRRGAGWLAALHLGQGTGRPGRRTSEPGRASAPEPPRLATRPANDLRGRHQAEPGRVRAPRRRDGRRGVVEADGLASRSHSTRQVPVPPPCSDVSGAAIWTRIRTRPSSSPVARTPDWC